MPRSRAFPPALFLAALAALAAAPAHAGLPAVSVHDARVAEGDTGTSNLVFDVEADGPPRRLQITYAVSDLTASAASGDYSAAGGMVTLTPEPARLIEHFGAQKFLIPTGIALAPNGDLLAVDGPGSKVHRFSSTGVLLRSTSVDSPVKVAVSAASEVYVLSLHGRVRVYNATGKLVRSFGDTTTVDVASDIAVDASGSVYVSDAVTNRIQKYTSAGSPVREWSTTPQGELVTDPPLGVAVDAQGFVYVAKSQSGRILKFAADGTLVATWTDTHGFCAGGGLHLDDAGNLLIADLHTSRVVVLDPQGAFLSEWMVDDGPIQNPTEFSATGVTSDHDGNVYVTIRQSATIGHYRWDRASGSIVVPVMGDTTPEPEETLQVQLVPNANATLAQPTAVGTIVNDDPQLGPNLVTNGQFESGLGGWGGTSGATLSLSLAGIEGNAARVLGTTSLVFGLNDSPNLVPFTSTGARYLYSAWVRSSSAGTAHLTVREYLGSVLQSTTNSSTITFDGSWQSVSVLVHPHAVGSSLDFQVMGQFSVAGQSFLIDNVAVQLLGADVPPVVVAPSEASGSWAREIDVDVTAHDPEGEPIDSLTADLSGLPGATFTVSADHSHGTLHWTPGFGAARDDPYPVTFTAHNAATSSATTLIHVSPDLVLNPSFEQNLTGWSGHSGATLTRVPVGRTGGYAARLTLPASGWAGLNDTPNWGVSSGHGRLAVFGAWVRSDTSHAGVRMQVREYQSGLLLATSTSVDGPLYSNKLTPEWHRVMLEHTCVGSGNSDLDLTIDVPSSLGATFDVDDVSIVSDGGQWTLDAPDAKPSVALTGRVLPNPARGLPMLELSLPAAGPLRIELYDIAGRRRAVVADESRAEAGLRRFALRAPEGLLTPGIYWYRASTASGTAHGRFVVIE